MKHASRSVCILHSSFCIANAALAASAAFAALPAGYTRVEYVEATGAQYIDTGVTPNQNTRVVVDIAYTRATAAGGGFGYAASGAKHSFRFWRTMTDGVATYRVNINNSYNTANDFPTTFADDTVRHLVDISNSSKKIDGVAFGDTSGLTQAVAGTMYLFAIHNGWKDSNNRYVGSWGYYRIYSCQIYSGQTLVRDFVPCVDSNGKAGLYDVANNKPYSNGGTGADLVAGPRLDGLNVTGASTAGTVVDFPETSPAAVTNGLAVGATVDCAAPAVCTNATIDTIATCVGYKVYTNSVVYMQGGTTNFTYVHPAGTGALLVWQYALKYKVTASAGAGGAASPAEQWVAEGAPATVIATPDPTHSFSQWNGDVPAGTNAAVQRLTFAVSRPSALTASFGAAPTTYYVSTNDLQEINGTIWGTYETDDGIQHAAYTNLQSAINAAPNGGTIWVEDGFVCSTGIGSTTFNNATRINCSGGSNKPKTLRSRSGNWRTGAEIRGDATTRCLTGANFNLIGFRLVGGTTTNSVYGGGGAIVDQAGNGVFENCLVADCSSLRQGGGIGRKNGVGTIVVRNCVITNCVTTKLGGGVNRADCYDSVFIGNRADRSEYTSGDGGGLLDGLASNCVFVANRALRTGGGAYNSTLTDCVVIGNVASNANAAATLVVAGGGIYGGSATGCVIADNAACGPENKKGANYFGSGGGAYDATLVRCLVTNNVSWYRGGGAYGGSAKNCLVADNEAFEGGGGFAASSSIFTTLIARNRAAKMAGVWTGDSSKTVLVSSTVTENENTSAGQTAVYRAAVTNSVVWGNLGESVRQTSTLQGAAYSCYLEADGTNGTTARNPKLADVDGKIYVATAGACRGKGLYYDWMDDGSVRSTDWYGSPRILGKAPDIGWVSLPPLPAHSVIYVQ